MSGGYYTGYAEDVSLCMTRALGLRPEADGSTGLALMMGPEELDYYPGDRTNSPIHDEVQQEGW